MNRPLRVFLCHSSNDKPAVRELYQKLSGRGLDVWLDEKKLLPGHKWKVEIPNAVREADVVVICLSKTSITKEGYVQAEIKFALDVALEKPEGTIFLIPARLEDCNVPNSLNDWHWVDLFDAQGINLLFKSLKKRAEALGLEDAFAEKEEGSTNKTNYSKFYWRSVHLEYKINADAKVINNYLLQHYTGISYQVNFDKLTLCVDEIEAFNPAEHDVFQYGFIAKGHSSNAVHGYFTVGEALATVDPKLESLPELFVITISQGQKDVSILSFDTDVNHAHMFTTELVRMLSKGFSIRITS